MKTTAETYGHAVMLNVTGDINDDTLPAFRQAVDHQFEDGDIVDLVLNLEGVGLMDSMALEYLLDLQEELAKKFGRIKLVKCDENVRKILEITRLDSAFEQYDRVAEAVKAVQA